MITTESIKHVLNVEQFGMSTDLIVPTPDVQKVSYFFFLLRHSMDSTEIPLSHFSAQNSLRSLKLTSIISSTCQLYWSIIKHTSMHAYNLYRQLENMCNLCWLATQLQSCVWPDSRLLPGHTRLLTIQCHQAAVGLNYHLYSLNSHHMLPI